MNKGRARKGIAALAALVVLLMCMLSAGYAEEGDGEMIAPVSASYEMDGRSRVHELLESGHVAYVITKSDRTYANYALGTSNEGYEILKSGTILAVTEYLIRNGEVYYKVFYISPDFESVCFGYVNSNDTADEVFSASEIQQFASVQSAFKVRSNVDDEAAYLFKVEYAYEEEVR